jgi:putative DNA primase/helicase
MRAAEARGLGVGIMLGGGVIGVDLDAVVNGDGSIEHWAHEIATALDTYCETSPSGRGLHLLLRATPPGARCRANGVEIYSSNRFFTITGQRLNDRGIEERSAALKEIYLKLFGPDAPQHSDVVTLPTPPTADSGETEPLTDDDKALIEAARALPGDGELFRKLWDGNESELAELVGPGRRFRSRSEADLSLASRLLRLCDGNVERATRLFRHSNLGRRKWETHRTYVGRTMRKAAESYQEFQQKIARNSKRISTVNVTGFGTTDTGNAERLVALFGEDIRYCHSQGTWYVWNGKYWEEDSRGAVMDMAKSAARTLYQQAWDITDPEERQRIATWALSSESLHRRRAAVTLAQSEPGIPIQPGDFDTDPFLLCCENGVIDLRTSELLPHRRELYISRMAPVPYVPGARCALWERFLEECCGGDKELIAFLQKCAGYSLTGSTAEEKLFFVHGPGASGKTSFVEALKSCLGTYAKTADFESFIARREAGGIRNDIAELAGRRFVVGCEVDDGRQLAVGLVKLLTGGDAIRARFLFREAFEFVAGFKLWLVSNHAPKIKHDDPAIWRRVIRLPFEHVVPEHKRDPELKAKLRDPRECGPAVLAWAVTGCLRWMREGLEMPRIVRQATEDLRQSMDPLRDFIADECVLHPAASAPASALRRSYEEWCERNGERFPLGQRAFSESLRSRGCEPYQGSHGTRRWRGIGLREPREEQ